VPMPSWEHAYFLGLLTASLVAAVAWSTYLGAGHHRIHFGLMGETCTAETVLTVRRRIQGWRGVSNLYFDGHGDVDLILIGPGGVFAIESKWTNEPWKVDAAGITGPLKSPTKQARLGARKAASTFRASPSPLALDVTPVVVLWGPGVPEIEGGSMISDDVLVAEGRRGQAWVQRLTGAQLTRQTVRSAFRKVESERRSRDHKRIALKTAPAKAGVGSHS